MAITDPNEQERVLTRRAQEKAQAQARMRHIAQAVDADGQVTVFDLLSGRYVRLWPVDAAAHVVAGHGYLKGMEPAAPAETLPAPPSLSPVGSERTLPAKGIKAKHKSAAAAAEAPGPDRGQPQ